jgi:serine/threonine protein kinase
LAITERYSILRELGAGQSKRFGRVFEGIEKVTGRRVLIKALSKELSTRAVHQLKNERTFSFHSTGLPEVLDFYESDTELILVKSYLEGVTLAEYWSTQGKNSSKIAFAQKLILELQTLFDRLKSENVVHCDLKPSNILIHSNNEEIQVSLIDFGLAVRSNDHKARKLIFPLGFAAPELILNRTDLVDQRTDIFSLGITLWYLFTGKLPLSHPNPSIYTNLQLTHPIQDDPSIPKGWFPILSKMTSKHVFRTAPNLMSPKDVEECLKDGISGRYTSLIEILEDLRNLPQKKSWFGF